MKIAVCSDLHLEFGTVELKNTESADVLILSGDICLASKMEKFMDFFEHVNLEFPVSLMVMGNHEHYHGDYAQTANIIRGTFGDLHNVHFLDKEWRIINGVLFYGGTLWTDMNGEDPATLRQIAYMMNDYRGVKNSAKTVQHRVPTYDENNTESWAYKERPAMFTPEDSVEDHKAFLAGLDSVLALHPNMPTVVVGHHAPSKASTHPKYKGEVITNGAYSTNLDNFILDRRQINLWTHGHTHEDFDYMIGTTRIVCNPRGYDGYEERADHFELKYVEV